MRRKTRLIFSIIAVILVLFFMSWAIWASLANIGIGGDISFSAENLEVTIAGRLYGHREDCMTRETAEKLEGATWTENTAEDNYDNNLDWSNLPLKFADKNSDIVIEVEIKNNHNSSAVVVGVQDNSVVKDKNFTISIECSGTATEDVIGVGETILYTITLRIIDVSKKVDGKLDVIFSLSNALQA